MSGTSTLAEGFAIYFDTSISGLSSLDGLVQLINSSGPIETVQGMLTISATVGGVMPGIGIVANSALIVTAAATSDSTNNPNGATLGSVITAASSVVGIVATLAGLAGVSGLAVTGLSAGSFVLGAGGFLLGLAKPDLRIGELFNAAQRWQPRRDPLTLDLDADGLETLAPSATHPILFDHDGDGTKSGTGWIKADDGFLVLDRNRNGVIDNGTELFGDATPLYAGGKAADGFAALAQEDSNQDGKVDRQDSHWTQLRVWRDLNQDGMSQADELFTLDQLDIASMNTALTAHSQLLENGNEIADLGTYVKADGTSGAMGDISRMADINLAEDTFHRQFSDHVPLAEGVAELPEMTGSGKVRDLREAASLSSDLRKVLDEYSGATSRQEQLALLDELLGAWADTSGLVKTLQERAGSSYVVNYRALGDWNATNFVANSGGTTQDSSGTGVTAQPANWSKTVSQWEKKLHILEAFNGRYFFNLSAVNQKASGAVNGLTVGAANANSTTAAVGMPLIVQLSQDQIRLLNQSYEALRHSVYDALIMQTRFKPLLELIDVNVSLDSIALSADGLTQEFQQRVSRSAEQGMSDLLEFVSYMSNTLDVAGWDGFTEIGNYVRALPLTPRLQAIYDEFHVRYSGWDSTRNQGSAKDDIVIGKSDGDSLYGGPGNDILIGGAGNDQLYGGDGSDVYQFGRDSGNDTIEESYYPLRKVDTVLLDKGITAADVTARRVDDGDDMDFGDLILTISGSMNRLRIKNYFYEFNANPYAVGQIKFADGTIWDTNAVKAKTLQGTSGDDEIVGYDGSDVIDGGAGNDFLYGGGGSDIYKFGRNSGNDAIIETEETLSEGLNDLGSDDTLLLEDGITADDVTIKRNVTVYGSDATGDALLLTIAGSNNKLRIVNYFYQNPWYGGNPYAIEHIKFADGTIWDKDAIKVKALQGTDGDDIILGYDSRDVLNGGAGDDWLDGGRGSDTYKFGRNSGNDIIHEQFGDTKATDIVLLDDGITATDVMVGRGYNRNNLLLKIAGSPNMLCIVNYFYQDPWDGGNPYAIEHIKFADGTTWDYAAVVMRLPVNGTEAADMLVGSSGISNSINGLAGNDQIAGADNDDILDGGAGDDTLIGGAGNDTFNVDSMGDILLESAGEGVDTVNSSTTYALGDNLENLALIGSANNNGAGNQLNNCLIGNTGNNILDGMAGTDTLIGGAGDDTYIVDNARDVVTEHGNEGVDAVQTKINYALPANVENLLFTGIANAGGMGNDLDNMVTGNDGNNTLSGRAGNDTIAGGAGDDMLDGGTDGDSLAGGIGDDIYYVDHVADLVIEHAGQGTDRVISRIDYTLGANAEDLFLDGSDNLNGTGNDLDNIVKGNAGDNKLIGGSGNDTLDGMQGADILLGGTGNDTYYLLKFAFSSDSLDAILENANEGMDTVLSSFSYALGANVENLILNRYDLSAANGIGNELDNVITGNGAANRLNGGAGLDLLQGGAGADELTDLTGNNLLDGGADNDLLMAGAGSDCIIGGTGNDTITTGSGADVIAFNRGDGKDVVIGGGSKEDTLSLGHGIRYADLLFKKTANDLVVETGMNEQITLKDWYAGSANRGIGKLQIIIEDTDDYHPESAGSLNNKKIAQFDFGGLVGEYDKALAATPGLDRWAMSSALLNFHLGGSDTSAIGGDLAYQYARSESLSALSAMGAQALLNSEKFGVTAQDLRMSSAVQDLSPRLM